MNFTEIKSAVAQGADLWGAEGYEIRISTGVSASAEALKDEISAVSYSRTAELTVRCIKEGKSGYASSEAVTPEEAAALTQRACANALVVDDKDEVPLFAGSPAYAAVEEVVPALPSADELKAHTMKLQNLAYAASDKVVDGTQSMTMCASSTTALMNSAGLDLCYETAYVLHGVAAAVRDGEEAEDEFALSPLQKKTPEELTHKAVTTALGKLGGTTVASGKYSIIMDRGTMCQLLGCFASVFSARSAHLKTTLLAGKEGQTVASPCLTLTDDPFHPEKLGHCPFDAEGVAVYAKDIITNGVLNTLLYNRMYAKIFGCESTGNAASAKNIAPRGLYIRPGTDSDEELAARMGTGLYITELKGLHAGANVQSGDFSLEAAGMYVENGKKVRPVKNFTIADNFYTLLKKVAAVSNRVEFETGSPFGSPEVLLEDIAVSGK